MTAARGTPRPSTSHPALPRAFGLCGKSWVLRNVLPRLSTAVLQETWSRTGGSSVPGSRTPHPLHSAGCTVPIIPAPTQELLFPSVPMDTGLGEHPEHHRAQVQSLGLQHRHG